MMTALQDEPVRDFEVPDGVIEWHKVRRQTSNGFQDGFNEAFLKGTYREFEPTPESENEIGPDDIQAIEDKMEQRDQVASRTELPSN